MNYFKYLFWFYAEDRIRVLYYYDLADKLLLIIIVLMSSNLSQPIPSSAHRFKT